MYSFSRIAINIFAKNFSLKNTDPGNVNSNMVTHTSRKTSSEAPAGAGKH